MKTVAIIGGGPAGYVAAVTAAQNGSKVILIEEKELGGVGYNDGCIPAKSLLKSAEVIQSVKNAPNFGIDVPINEVKANWEKVQEYKSDVVKGLVGEIWNLMEKNQIRVIKGKASFMTNKILRIEGADSEEVIEVDSVIISTGSVANELPTAPYDEEWVIDSEKVQSLPTIPSSLLIVGGGVIGCEYASIYSRLGTKVTLLDRSNQLLKGEDPDVANILQQQLESDGVTIRLRAEVKQLDYEKKQVIFGNDEVTLTESPEYVLISIGRKARVSELNLDRIGVSYSQRGVAVNTSMQTNIPNIYACGDVVGGMKLAHVAFHEGKVAALNACGYPVKVDLRSVPRCIYTTPEIAGVGLSEEQARNVYGDVLIGEASFHTNAKAVIHSEKVGKIKVIVEPETDEILGFSIVGPRATELIGQGALVMHAEITTNYIKDSIAAHPTLSEAVQEAMLAAKRQAVYSLNR